MHSGFISAILAACAVASQALPAAEAACKVNTFKNGKFENDTLAPWTSTGDAGYSVTLHSPGYKSTYAASITPPESQTEPSQAQFIQAFDLCPKTNYTLAFEYRLSELTGQGNALSVTAGPFQVYQFQSFTSANLKYQPAQTTFVTSGKTGTFLNFQFLNFDTEATPSLYLDNVKVTKTVV